MLPNLKIAFTLANMARKYSHVAFHAGDADLLTRDLGDAMRRQKKIIQDPDMSVLETATEAFPVVAEIKLLSMLVAQKLDLDTRSKPTAAVLDDIVRATEARNSNSAVEIKRTLDWTRGFFAHPEVQAILDADMIKVSKPDGPMDVQGMGKATVQGTQRVAQGFYRFHKFLSKAKKIQDEDLKHLPPSPPGKKNGPAV